MKRTILWVIATIAIVFGTAFFATGCELFFGSDVTPPEAPGELNAVALISGQIELSWIDNSQTEEWFTIERSEDLGLSFSVRASTAPNSTSFVDAAISPATTYHYRVSAGNKGGESIPSNLSYAVSLASPLPASDLVATAVSSNQIDLTWTDNSSNEDWFELERSLDSGTTFTLIGIVGADVTMYTDWGLDPGTEYIYRIIAVNTAAASTPSDTATGTTFSLPPAAPDALVATAAASDRIDLSWNDNSDDETNFRVLRSDDVGSNYTIIATLVADTSTFTDTALASNTEYVYAVYAFNALGFSASTDPVSATTLNFSGRFLAVGQNGAIVYSDDGGNTWTVVSDDDLGTSFLHDVAYDPVNKRLVAIGDGGYGFFSDDGGETWDEANISTTEDLYAITWGPYSGSSNAGRFFATGTGSNLFYSDTGASGSWTAVDTLHATYWDLAFGNDILVLLVSNYLAVRSNDGGDTFNSDGNSGIYGRAVVYGSSRFIGAGRDGSDNNEGFNYSVDGTSWTSALPAGVVPGAIDGMGFDEMNTVIAVGFENTGDTGRIWYTTDEGSNWGFAGGPLPDQRCYGVAYGEGVWVTVGEMGSGNVWLSTDVDSWSAVTAGAERLDEVIYLE